MQELGIDLVDLNRLEFRCVFDARHDLLPGLPLVEQVVPELQPRGVHGTLQKIGVDLGYEERADGQGSYGTKKTVLALVERSREIKRVGFPGRGPFADEQRPQSRNGERLTIGPV